MIHLQNSLVISRSPEEVFAFLSDYGNVPLWNHFLLEVTKSSAGLTDLGVVYHQVSSAKP